jgi:ArsR family transcriptional regulator, virulence genes transcriptional regulator
MKMDRAAAKRLLGKCEEVSELLGALAHPVRLKVLCETMESEKSVGELTEFCGISQSAMSQFLRRMKSDGLLDSRRQGTRIFYAVKDPRVARLLAAIKEICT